jgi:uncharacterized protein YndB with AHSA1/START domain
VHKININENAAVVARAEIEIKSDPKKVWEVLVDIENWPLWNPDVKNASLEGEVAVGSKFRWKARSISINSVFKEVDPPNELSWTGKTMGIKAVHIWKLEVKDDHTIIKTAESWEGPLTHIMKGKTQKMLQESIDSGLKYLKAELDRKNSLGQI